MNMSYFAKFENAYYALKQATDNLPKTEKDFDNLSESEREALANLVDMILGHHEDADILSSAIGEWMEE